MPRFAREERKVPAPLWAIPRSAGAVSRLELELLFSNIFERRRAPRRTLPGMPCIMRHASWVWAHVPCLTIRSPSSPLRNDLHLVHQLLPRGKLVLQTAPSPPPRHSAAIAVPGGKRGVNCVTSRCGMECPGNYGSCAAVHGQRGQGGLGVMDAKVRLAEKSNAFSTSLRHPTNGHRRTGTSQSGSCTGSASRVPPTPLPPRWLSSSWSALGHSRERGRERDAVHRLSIAGKISLSCLSRVTRPTRVSGTTTECRYCRGRWQLNRGSHPAHLASSMLAGTSGFTG